VKTRSSDGVTLASARAALVAMASIAASGEARAQSTVPASRDRIDEIVVTAQRREQSIQDVGASVTALQATDLEHSGLNSATDIAQQVPGLQYQAFSPTITIFNLRGVSQNDFADLHEAPVAVYADDVYVASMGAVSGAIYDLDRVEVLRGPQGTLFGRNATGGLIHYISARPVVGADQGYLRVSGGHYGDLETEGAWNHGLTEESATRLSFATTRHAGIIRNLAGPDANTADQYAARLQYLLRLPGQGQLLLKGYYLRNQSEVSPSYSWNASCNDLGLLQPGQSCPGSYAGLGAFVGQDANPYGTGAGCDQSGYCYPNAFAHPFTQAFDRRGVFDRTLYGVTAHVDWRLGSALLTSITDYMHLEKRYGEDSDASPHYQLNFDTWLAYHQLSQELHVSGGERLHWIAGLYLLDLSNNGLVAESANAQYLGFVAQDQGPQYTLDTRSLAAFGQLEMPIALRWSLTGGVRYTRDTKQYSYTLWNPSPGNALLDANGIPYVYDGHTAPGLADHHYDLYSGKLELDFKPVPGALLYASVNRGPKSGGWSAPVNASGSNLSSDLFAVLAYKPETLVDYEIGTKLSLLEGRARLSADAFYYDYRNYQAFLLRNLTQIIGNADARLYGGELELAVLPVHGLTLEGGLSLLSTRIGRLALPDGSLADREMPNAPHWSLDALARYEWPGTGGTWSLQCDGKWNAAQWLENVNAPVDLQPGYGVMNLRAGFASGRHWDLTVWVRNATNKYYRVYSLDLSGLGYNESVYGNPRWLGATLDYRWGN
jgi:iron complex outermembrane recepter protein